MIQEIQNNEIEINNSTTEYSFIGVFSTYEVILGVKSDPGDTSIYFS